MNRWILGLLAGLFACSALMASEPVPTYEGQIKAILARHCLKCHSGDRPRGELDVSTFSALMQGGISGKAVVAGQSGESSLYTMTAHLEEPKMPPNSPKIPQSELDLLKKWIDGGALEKSVSTSTVAPSNGTVSVKSNSAGFVSPADLPRQSAVTALACNGQVVAYPGFKQILLVDLASQKVRHALPFPDGEVHVLRFSQSGKTLLVAGGVGGKSGVVTAFDLTSGQRLGTINDTSDAVMAADLAPDEKRVVFGGPSRVVKVAEWPNGKIVHTLKKPTDWVLATAFSPDGLLVAAADRFGGVHLWEARSGQEFLTLRAHGKAATSLAWRVDSAALATASEDGQVKVWDLHTSQLLREWTAHEAGILDLAWPTQERLITAGRDRLIKVWDANGQFATKLGPMSDVVLRVASAANGTVIAGDWSGQIKLWNASQPAGIALPRPIKPQPRITAMIPVPLPEVVPVAAINSPMKLKQAPEMTTDDLLRKRETLAMLEASAERLKEEAARNPTNTSLKAAYLQVCEAVLVMKAEVIATESALKKP